MGGVWITFLVDNRVLFDGAGDGSINVDRKQPNTAYDGGDCSVVGEKTRRCAEMNVEELIAKAQARPLPDGRVASGVLVEVYSSQAGNNNSRFSNEDKFLAVISDKEISLPEDVQVSGLGTNLAKAIIGLRSGEEKEVGGRVFLVKEIYGLIE